jgi:hypothetical protein
LTEIESTPFETYFESKEARKKSYRRLLRVSLELRDILIAIFDRGNEVLRASLSAEAFNALRSCLDVVPTPAKESSSPASSHKETLVRKLLSSSWVAKFQDVDIRGRMSLPEQLQTTKTSSTDQTGISAIEDLLHESDEIVLSFEKSLNACFEKYLEAQRNWAETGAVRDLECEGDATMKRLSQRHSHDSNDFAKLIASKNLAADERWKGIDRNINELWQQGYNHWRIPKYTDRLGRRVLLVRNRQFDDHGVASYDLQMGMGREKEEKEREERLRKKQERVSEVMKRNVDAFKSLNIEEEDEEEKNLEDIGAESDRERLDSLTSDSDIESSRDRLDSTTTTETEFHTTMETFQPDEIESGGIDPTGKVDSDIDSWAKAFIWTDSESVVARFDSVMIVTLQYLVEGKLLLTTHGLYFHQTNEGTNIITKESGSKFTFSVEANDRRWRLSRLIEVHGRRYMLRSQALELFFSGSHELFLNFLEGSKERDRFYAKLRNSCRVSSTIFFQADLVVFKYEISHSFWSLNCRYRCYSPQSL